MKKSTNNKTEKLPKGIKSLLWEYNVKGNNIKGLENNLILRILQFGSFEEIQWMFKKFGYEKVLSEFVRRGYRHFSSGNFEFWFRILKLIKNNKINWASLRAKRLLHKKLNPYWHY